MKTGGWYSFHLSADKIREYKDLPPEEKLDWLEDANNFVNCAVSEEKRKLWARLKNCETSSD